jgi:hypothetical protein
MDEERSPDIEDSASICTNFMVPAKNVGLSLCIIENVFVTQRINGGLNYFQNRDPEKFISLQNTFQRLSTFLVVVSNKSY